MRSFGLLTSMELSHIPNKPQIKSECNGLASFFSLLFLSSWNNNIASYSLYLAIYLARQSVLV